MEVGGKRADSTAATFCQPCTDAGDSVAALKLCSVCKEWLCVTCIEYHRRFKATKTHTLLDKDSVSDTTAEQDQSNTTHFCDAHPAELIKYFCPTHDTVHCGDCAASKSCKLDKLSSISSNIRNKREFKELQSNIVQLIQGADALESKVNTIVESVEEEGDNHLDQVARHEQWLIEKIKAHSAGLKDDVNIAMSETKYQLSSVIDTCTDIRSTGEQLSNGLDESNANDSEVFIAFIKAKPVLQTKSDELIAAGRQSKVKHYRFKKCLDIETMLQTSKSFGTYEADVEDVQPSLSTGRPKVKSMNVPQRPDDTGITCTCLCSMCF